MTNIPYQVVASSLQSMLDFEDSGKFQESFMVNFEVSYMDMFGHEHKHELKEAGKTIPVTMDNRQVLCLYTSHVTSQV